MRLSIIITVYNKEKYLQRCLESVFNQISIEEGDYEVLIVNDGSTDNSSAIINEYCANRSIFRLINQNNQGVAITRNNGLKEAKGDYIWFVDADDYIEPNAVQLICEAMQSCPDVIPIYARTYGIDRIRNKVNVISKTGKDIIVGGHWEQGCVFWVLRRDFLTINNLLCMPGIYHEDAEFTPRMLYMAKSVVVVPYVLYTVIRGPDSITQVPRPQRAFDYLVIAEHLCQFVIDSGELSTNVGRAINLYTAQDINNALSVICKNGKREQKLLNDAFYNKKEALIKALKSSNCLKYQAEALLFQLFPKKYVEVYSVMKRL